MSKRLVILLSSIVVVAGGLFSLLSSPSASFTENEQWPTVRPLVGPMTNSVTAIGTVRAGVGSQVKVGSQISGVVEKLNVNVGDTVKKGDVLALLNTQELRVRVDVLAADLRAAKAELVYADAELRRFQAIPDLSRNQIEGLRRNADVRRYAVERAEAQLQQARIQLGYATITAPLSGTIESVSTYEGETVAASFAAPTFVTIIDLDHLEIECYVDETDVGSIHVGQKVEFSVDAFPGEVQYGAVRAILPKAELINSVVNYVVIVDLQDRGKIPLRPQMTARVNLLVQRKENAMTVPRGALIREGAASYVAVRASDGWVKREVQVGLATSPRVEILSGLEPNDAVLADGQLWMAQSEAKR